MSASCHGPAPGKDATSRGVSQSLTDDRAPLVALVGRPNAGKSSLFNAVTGGHAHVGNFPGITVDILEGDARLPNGQEATIADLPGLYSLEAVVERGTDEGIARTFLERAAQGGRPLVVVQVVDASRLALGLRLTRELVRRSFRLLVVATQRDALEAEGSSLDTGALSGALGVPVIAVSARERGLREAVMGAIEAELAGAPRAPAEPTWDADAVAAAVLRPASKPGTRQGFTAKADAILLHPLLGPILFLAVMAALFSAVFLIADPVSAAIDGAVTALRSRLFGALGGGLLASFIGDGLLGGAGTVLAFMPQIVILTVAMELLEASGYLARGAFLVDRLLRLLGLSGQSFLPLLMGHACAVPAISATRIIRNPRERLTAVLVLPLMTCSARIPTYGVVIGAFFAARSALFKGLLFVGLYFAGILAGLVASAVLRRTATKGRSLPLVLEMPGYRMPQARVVARKGGRAAWRFARDVGTTILAASAVLWVLLTVPRPGAPPMPTPAAAVAASTPEEVQEAEKQAKLQAAQARLERSLAAGLGKALEPVTAPLGFDWRINVGLIGSFGARELMVGTLAVIYGIEGADDDPTQLREQLRDSRRADGTPAYGARTGLALLAFFLFACQCMSTVAAIRRETKTWRWPAFVLVYTYGAGYAAALLVYQIAGRLGLS